VAGDDGAPGFMTYFPPIPSSGALWTTLQQVLDPPSSGPLWYLGPESFSRRLTLQGYTFADGAGPVRQVLWVRSLPASEAAAVGRLVEARDRLVPGGRVVVVELAAPPAPWQGRLGRLWVRWGWSLPSDRLARWFLQAGLSPVCQRWPQGMRAWLVTCSEPGSPFSHTFPVQGSQSAIRMAGDPGGES
jgi:hypothetical protein